MSGGVDSSVTAKLLTEQVRSSILIEDETILFKLGVSSAFARIMTYQLSSCEIGTPMMNLVPIVVANGKKTGKTWGVCVVCWIFLVRWSLQFQVSATRQKPSNFLADSAFLSCKVDLSREYWNRVFEPSLRMWEMGETPNPDVWCNRWEFKIQHQEFHWNVLMY